MKHVFVKAAARVNNRAENSHQPTRERERRIRGFRLPGRTQAFLSCVSPAHDSSSDRQRDKAVESHISPASAAVVDDPYSALNAKARSTAASQPLRAACMPFCGFACVAPSLFRRLAHRHQPDRARRMPDQFVEQIRHFAERLEAPIVHLIRVIAPQIVHRFA